MHWLPRQQEQHRFAVMLLALGLILIYQLGFSWYFEVLAAQSSKIGVLQAAQARAAGLSRQRPAIEAALENVRLERLDRDGFLTAADANIGTAELVSILKQAALSTANGEPCQLRRHLRNRLHTTERFARVSIQAQFICSIDAMAGLLYRLERTDPYLYIDTVMIEKKTMRRGLAGDQLILQFNLAAYLAPN